MRKPNPVRGFTIIELMMTVAVAGVVLMLAVPPFQGFINRTQLETAASEVVSVFQNARETAVTGDVDVSIVQDVDGVVCSFSGSTCLGYDSISSSVTLTNDNSFSFRPTGMLDVANPSVTVSVNHSEVSTHRYEINILSSGRVTVRQVQI